MLFIKLVRVLAAGLAVGLICHLLYSAGKKSTTTRQKSNSGTRRKFVESSVVEKKDETSESDKEKS